MCQYLDLFGLKLPTYWLLGLVGAGFAILLVYCRNRKEKYRLPGEDVLGAILYGAIGAFIGAKILYIITMIPSVVENFSEYLANPLMFLDLLRAGIVYYGGLYGGIFGGYLYLKRYKQPLSKAADLMAPGIPLFHVFGRIGCFFAGCCYGFESVYGFEFMTTPGHTHFPIQLVEAALNIVIVIVLIATEKKRRRGSGIVTYLYLYAVVRFVLEFFRGDVIRGHLWVFSTSQWIALITVVVLTVFEIRRVKREKMMIAEGAEPEAIEETSEENTEESDAE